MVIDQTVVCCVCASLLDYLMNQEPDNDLDNEMLEEMARQEKLKN